MKKAIIIIIVLAIIALLCFIAYKIYMLMTAKKIYRNGRNKKNFAYNYLSVRFGSKKVAKNINLPYTDRNGNRRLAHADLIFINRGGVFVIKPISGSGFVELFPIGTWRKTYNDKVEEFENPLNVNQPCIGAVKRILKEEGIENIPVHNIALFTGRKLRFSKNTREVISADKMTSYFLDLNKDRFLLDSEIKKVMKLIKQKNINPRNFR